MEKGFAFIELKTTGRNPVLDSIFYIAITTFDTNLVAKKSYSVWLNPEQPLTELSAKVNNITYEELKDYPLFTEIYPQVKELIKDRRLGSFSGAVDVLEFLREAMYDEGDTLKYDRKNFIYVKGMEDAMFRRNLDTLYYKYTAKKLNENSHRTKELGEIFKAQCEFLGADPVTFKMGSLRNVANFEVIDRYLYKDGEDVFISFGKYTNRNLKDIPQNYLKWMMEDDFPAIVKQEIENYIENE